MSDIDEVIKLLGQVMELSTACAQFKAERDAAREERDFLRGLVRNQNQPSPRQEGS